MSSRRARTRSKVNIPAVAARAGMPRPSANVVLRRPPLMLSFSATTEDRLGRVGYQRHKVRRGPRPHRLQRSVL